MTWIVGIDEAGRGPLAGPVVAAAVVLDSLRPIAGLGDSKALSEAAREALAPQIREQALAWCIGVASAAEIDRLNILQATLLAMRRALSGLQGAGRYPRLEVEVDGNKLPSLNGIPGLARASAIVKGDALSASIGAASILAKTSRDHVMEQLDRRYPQYGFAIHKGYPTAAHRAALQRHGVTPVHRRSFGPVKSALR